MRKEKATVPVRESAEILHTSFAILEDDMALGLGHMCNSTLIRMGGLCERHLRLLFDLYGRKSHLLIAI